VQSEVECNGSAGRCAPRISLALDPGYMPGMSVTARPTIFALSSGRPPAAIAVIRISGSRARIALAKMIGRVPPPRHASLAKVRDPASGEIIDEGLALWFPGPHSETGEDMAELQVHGGRAVIADVLAALGQLDGFRHAEAGEFTRRAFENGRMDLTAVEGLADLVAAETAAQRSQALSQMQGHFARAAERWREKLIEARALVEAGIDFSDEGDVPKNLARQALAIARPVMDEIARAAAGHGERIRDGLQVVIAGAPNVGKSTLLNRIAQRDVAIVSPHPGTTRDVIEVHLDLAGFPVTLRDTAGIRETAEPVEQEGVRRAQASACAADLVLWVVDACELARDGATAVAQATTSGGRADGEALFVVNKIDLLDAPARERIELIFITSGHTPPILVSAATGAGIDQLIARIGTFASGFLSGEPALVTRERHRQLLQAAASALAGALDLGETRGTDAREELIAEQLRLATRALEKLTGRVDVEDILDVIFRDFCIGK
jgi:tRNA modification GTPase